MKTKKIWLLAFFFGIIVAGTLYLTLFSKQEEAAPTEAAEPQTDQEVIELEDDENGSEEEEEQNPMLPIESGKRAMSLEVNDVQGVSGFVQPGDFVDLVYISNPPEEVKESGQHAASTLLLQKVKVLAVGHSADVEETARRYQTVTLEVDPKEGLALGFATKDELYLMLRNPGDEIVNPEHYMHIHEDVLHKGVYY